MKLKAILKNERLLITSFVVAIVFSIFAMFGMSINADGSLLNSFFLIDIVNFCVLILILFVLIVLIYWIMDCINLKFKITWKYKNKYIFFIIWLLIFLCFVPFLLNFYPAVITPDSADQIYQALGENDKNNHHPILHTMIIGAFLNIGNSMFGNPNLGISFFVIFQMLCLSFTFALIIFYMIYKKVNVLIIGISMLYFMFYPVHSVYSITIWKDIPFAIFMAFFVILISEILDNASEFFKSKKKVTLFIAVSILMMFFRNNGIYVYILTSLFLIIGIKKHRKYLGVIFIITLVIYEITKSLLFITFNVEKGEAKEALSIPLQQISRIYAYNRDSLSEEEIIKINKFFPVDNLEELYYPKISDNVKTIFSEEIFQQNKIEFFSLWIKLCIHNMPIAIDAFLNNCYGYWYPLTNYWVTMTGIDSGSCNISEKGIYSEPQVNSEIINILANVPNYKDSKFISLFFSIGMFFWIILLMIGYLVYHKRYRMILMYVPILILWLTTIASPVFCEFRYVYGMFVCFPLLVGCNFKLKNEKEE